MLPITAGNSSEKTYYDALSVKEDSTYDEIRQNYKAAILNSHPDKLQTKSDALNSQINFLDVRKAWEVLSDSNSRSNYDKELRALRCEDHIGADEIRLEEMLVEDDAGDSKEFFYQCRCGDYFSISVADLEEMGISTSALVLLPCGSCSLKIWLVLNVNC